MQPIREKLLNHPILPRNEILELVGRAQEGDIEARNTVLLHNQQLIFSIAAKYSSSKGQLELDDLIQEGNFGLLRAIEKFDLETGNAFSTYAYYWVRSRIRRFVQTSSGTITRGPGMMDRVFSVRKAMETLRSDYPSEEVAPKEEILIYLQNNGSDISMETLKIVLDGETLGLWGETYSLDFIYSDDQPTNAVTRHAPSTDSAEDQYLKESEFKESINRLRKNLTPKELQAFEMIYYSAPNMKPRPQHEVAKELNVSRACIQLRMFRMKQKAKRVLIQTDYAG